MKEGSTSCRFVSGGVNLEEYPDPNQCLSPDLAAGEVLRPYNDQVYPLFVLFPVSHVVQGGHSGTASNTSSKVVTHYWHKCASQCVPESSNGGNVITQKYYDITGYI